MTDIIAARESRIEEGMKSYDEDKRKLAEYNKNKQTNKQINSVKTFRRMQRNQCLAKGEKSFGGRKKKKIDPSRKPTNVTITVAQQTEVS